MQCVGFVVQFDLVVVVYGCEWFVGGCFWCDVQYDCVVCGVVYLCIGNLYYVFYVLVQQFWWQFYVVDFGYVWIVVWFVVFQYYY